MRNVKYPLDAEDRVLLDQTHQGATMRRGRGRPATRELLPEDDMPRRQTLYCSNRELEAVKQFLAAQRDAAKFNAENLIV